MKYKNDVEEYISVDNMLKEVLMSLGLLFVNFAIVALAFYGLYRLFL